MAYVLSDNDIAILRRIIARENSAPSIQNPGATEATLPHMSSFLFKSPEDGIDGMTKVGDEYVTGKADCELLDYYEYGSDEMRAAERPAEPTVWPVRNPYERRVGGDQLFKATQLGGFFVVDPPPDKTRLTGIVTVGNLFEEATAADTHTIGSLEGINAPWNGTSTLNVYNPRKHKLWLGCIVAVEYNISNSHWEVYDAQADKIVQGIKVHDCVFKKLIGATGWTNWDEGHEAEWVTSVYNEDCALLYDTNCAAGVGQSTGLNTDFIRDISWNNTTCQLTWTKDADCVTYPASPSTTITLDYVYSVTMNGDALYYTSCASGDHLIAQVGPCYEAPACGEKTWTVDANLVWQLDAVQANDCTGDCVSGGSPTEVAVVEGQTTSVPCVTPP